MQEFKSGMSMEDRLMKELQDNIKSGAKLLEWVSENDSFISNTAKLQRKYFDALVAEGFTEDQAISIISAAPMTAGGTG